MYQKKTFQKRKIVLVGCIFALCGVGLSVRLGYLMVKEADHYQKLALELHQRERSVKAERGIIYDRNGVVLAGNKAVCTISVIHSQLKEKHLSKLESMVQEEVFRSL